nr:hypothetical protein GCM10020092_022120 [Actinoplanes digitatis]
MAYAFAMTILLLVAWLVWRQVQAPDLAVSAAPLGSAPADVRAGLPVQPSGTGEDPGAGNAAAPGPRAPDPTTGGSRRTSPDASPSPSKAVQLAVTQKCTGRLALRAGMSADLATCTASSGGASADLLFTSAGIDVRDGIKTRQAGKNGSDTATNYDTCNGLFLYPGHPDAEVPITTAACLRSDRSVAYIDIIERDSTHIVVNLLAWKLR